jgi:hypothetical protein
VRAVAVLVALIALATAQPALALSAAAVYALTHTAELVAGLALYFGGEPVG